MATPTYLEPRFSGLEYCIGVAQRLHRNAGGNASFEEFGKIIDNSPKSSHFLLKVNSMKAYGLATTEKGHIKLTPLGEMVAVPKDQDELAGARRKAIVLFPLFKSLVERYTGKGEPDREFIENALRGEKVAEDKVSAWAECFLRSARYAGLFGPTVINVPGLTLNLGQHSPAVTESAGKPTASDSDFSQSGDLSLSEVPKDWLKYEIAVRSGKARIVVPPDLSHQAWERLKKLLDAIEPEKQNGLKDILKDLKVEK